MGVKEEFLEWDSQFVWFDAPDRVCDDARKDRFEVWKAAQQYYVQKAADATPK